MLHAVLPEIFLTENKKRNLKFGIFYFRNTSFVLLINSTFLAPSKIFKISLFSDGEQSKLQIT